MSNLVLSIFPGIDLLGRAFEEEGFCVVRGPDLLWGGDIRTFHPSAGVFEGIISGPPCQIHSEATKMFGTREIDMIPEFVRVVEEAKPKWVVMENVKGAAKSGAIPLTWFKLRLRDWDCGGLTCRTRLFWVWPAQLILVPPKRPGKPEYSVLATSWKIRSGPGRQFRGHSYIKLDKAAELQGYPELLHTLKFYGVRIGVHLLGNGVPKAMGLFIAKATKAYLTKEEQM